MSKEQLGWDQILDTSTSEDAGATASKADAQTHPQDASETKAAKTTKVKKTSSRKRKSGSTTTVEETQVQYSKKDWGKLETTVVTAEQTSVSVDSAKQEVSVTTQAVASVTAKVKAPSKPVEEAPHWVPFDDLDAEPEKSDEPQLLTVSELNKYIRELLEGQFATIWVKAEISNFKAHTSGHFYFSLKDSRCQISAVMFRGFNSALRFRPEDGMEVIVRGKITVYEPRGNYQIFCEYMEPVGAGALQKAYEQLKAKLQAEGLFDLARKRPMPALPKHIAIVTSPTGAAIRDMLNVLGRRFKGAQITLVPCKVQGDAAPREICAAIQLANQLPDVDVMIVGRGGGSIEDLWAFNDEKVARAIAASRVPVISAVGHEIDFTIADFVADLRAPTPSAAAELVVQNAADLIDRIAGIDRALRLAILRSLQSNRQLTTSISKRLVDPQRRIQDASLRCDELMQRLEAAALRSLQNRRMGIRLLRQKLGTPEPRLARQREKCASLNARLRAGIRSTLVHHREHLQSKMALLDSLSPMKVLDRGFSMVVAENEIVTDAGSLKPGQNVTVRMCKGSIEAQVTKVNTDKR